MNATSTDSTQATAGEETSRTWRIAASNIERARSIVERVNRRAKRAGLPGYTITITPAPDRQIYDDEGANTVVRDADGELIPAYNGIPCRFLYSIAQVDVTVHGAVPCLNGWEVVAVITHDIEAGVITRPWSGLGGLDLTPLRGRESGCDHCKTSRYRRETFAVRNTATGELLQVGRNCLAVFTGLDVNISDDWFGRPKEDDEFDLLGTSWADDDIRVPVPTVVEYAVAAVKLYGWTSREMSTVQGRSSTSDLVKSAFIGQSTAANHLREKLTAAQDAATVDRAAKMISWAKAQVGNSEYIRNLAALAGCESVSIRNIGLLASVVAAYARHEQEEIERQRGAGSIHQGVVGKRQVFAGLTVASVHTSPGFYGVSYVVKFVDDAGNRFTWFSSKDPSVEPGSRVDVKGTVKKHTWYRGVAETALTRCVCTEAAA